MERAEVKK